MVSDGHEKEEEEVLLRLYRSRKAFLIEYSCGLLLLLLVLIGYAQGIAVPPVMRSLMVGLALVAVGSAEISRQFIRYKITPSKLMVIKGFIKQSKKNVYFHSLAFIPDINVHQSRIQRLLGYGTIHLYGGGNMSERIEITDINHPKDVLHKMEELVTGTRKK